MAIWQYQLTVIPQDVIIDLLGKLPDKLFIDKEARKIYWNNISNEINIVVEDAWTFDWWKFTKIDIELIANQIDKLVTRGSFNNSDFLSWKGDDKINEDNDAGICIDEETGKITDFRFRTDLRKFENISMFLYEMIKICNANDFLLMNNNGDLFEADIKIISEDLIKSNAARFLTDPIKFLESIEINKN